MVKCAGMFFRVGVGVPSYETDDRDRECNDGLKSDLNSVWWFLHVTSCNGIYLYHTGLGTGMVPLWLMNHDGPSLIASWDFCVSMKLRACVT